MSTFKCDWQSKGESSQGHSGVLWLVRNSTSTWDYSVIGFSIAVRREACDCSSGLVRVLHTVPTDVMSPAPYFVVSASKQCFFWFSQSHHVDWLWSWTEVTKRWPMAGSGLQILFVGQQILFVYWFVCVFSLNELSDFKVWEISH